MRFVILPNLVTCQQRFFTNQIIALINLPKIILKSLDLHLRFAMPYQVEAVACLKLLGDFFLYVYFLYHSSWQQQEGKELSHHVSFSFMARLDVLSQFQSNWFRSLSLSLLLSRSSELLTLFATICGSDLLSPDSLLACFSCTKLAECRLNFSFKI